MKKVSILGIMMGQNCKIKISTWRKVGVWCEVLSVAATGFITSGFDFKHNNVVILLYTKF